VEVEDDEEDRRSGSPGAAAMLSRDELRDEGGDDDGDSAGVQKELERESSSWPCAVAVSTLLLVHESRAEPSAWFTTAMAALSGEVVARDDA